MRVADSCLQDSYDLGNQFGHFALAVPDVYKAVDKIKADGEACPRMQPSVATNACLAAHHGSREAGNLWGSALLSDMHNLNHSHASVTQAAR